MAAVLLLLDLALGLSPPSRSPPSQCLTRRAVAGAAAAAILAPSLHPSPAHALIKGSAPPPKSKPKERKCSNIDECQALGEAERAAQAAGQDTTIERTVGGDRYRDLAAGSGRETVAGDAVEIRYRVMRLGPKSNDGLSGEGQTIFSLGYGEDDDKEGDALPVQLAGKTLVPGVNDALLGMQPGGRRRVLVRPERGWRVQTGACARGEEKGMTDLNELTKRVDAQDGNLVFKADIGAAIENENACQNKEALPQPRSYGAKARFGRRFDESLLVEVDLVGFTDAKKAAAASNTFVYDQAEVCRQNPFAEGCDVDAK